jgi:hypothetical protein
MQLKGFIRFSTVGIVLALIAVPAARATDDGTLLAQAAAAAPYASLEPGQGFSFMGPVPLNWRHATSAVGHRGGGAAGATGAAVPQLRDGFDWGDAGIGGGFVAGLLAVSLGAATMLRKRRMPAHTH